MYYGMVVNLLQWPAAYLGTKYMFLVPIIPYYMFSRQFFSRRPASSFPFPSNISLMCFVTNTEAGFHIPSLYGLIYLKPLPYFDIIHEKIQTDFGFIPLFHFNLSSIVIYHC